MLLLLLACCKLALLGAAWRCLVLLCMCVQVRLLSDVNQMVFDSAEAAQVAKLAITTEEIKACCDDLKLLGKLDFKNLLKWRTEVLRNKMFQKKVSRAYPSFLCMFRLLGVVSLSLPYARWTCALAVVLQFPIAPSSVGLCLRIHLPCRTALHAPLAPSRGSAKPLVLGYFLTYCRT